jgi:hypothetical protein
MKRGLIVFAVIMVVGTWACSLAAWALQDTLKQMVVLVMLPASALPFLAAFIGQRVNNHVGNPFRGLTFGATGWIFLVWLVGLLLGYFAAVACIAFGLHGLDLSMADYIARTVAAAEQAGSSIPAEGQGKLKIAGYITVSVLPLLGVWFSAAAYCLTTFPMYGWFARRLLAYGRPAAIFTLLAINAVAVVFAGLMDNPQLAGTAIWERTLIMLALAVCFIPGMLWLLLRTRSAVIPALAQASVKMALAGATPIIAGDAPLLGLPSGLLPSAIILAAGIALWLWQDPGGKELVVADVAHDGTLLTPEMVAELREPSTAQELLRQAHVGADAVLQEPPAP